MTVTQGPWAFLEHMLLFLLYVWLLAANGRKGEGVGPRLLEEKLRRRRSVQSGHSKGVRVLAINSE